MHPIKEARRLGFVYWYLLNESKKRRFLAITAYAGTRGGRQNQEILEKRTRTAYRNRERGGRTHSKQRCRVTGAEFLIRELFRPVDNIVTLFMSTGHIHPRNLQLFTL